MKISSGKGKSKYLDYKQKGTRERHKATRFERWIKGMVKRINTPRGISYYRLEKSKEGRKFVRYSKNTWSFGPFGYWENNVFVEKIPVWMQTVVSEYSEYYNSTPRKKREKVTI